MSMDALTESTSSSVPSVEECEDLVDALQDKPGLCSYCFNERRIQHDDYTKSVLQYLRDTGRRSLADSLRGFSSLSPTADREVPPPRANESPRPETVCSVCGRLDPTSGEPRSIEARTWCVENIADVLARDGVEISVRAAKQVVEKAGERDYFASRDVEALGLAVHLGWKHATA